jgi:hypothetical protein
MPAANGRFTTDAKVPRELDFYAQAAAMTAVGKHKALVDELPSEIGELARITQGLLIYTNHYRRGPIRLLEFGSNNTAHQPVVDALALIVRYAHHGGTYYPLGEHVVLEGAVNADWNRAAHQDRLARADPCGARRLRGVRLSGAARAAAVQGDLGRRRATNGETPTRTS